jgi:hypothetical protein
MAFFGRAALRGTEHLDDFAPDAVGFGSESAGS